MIHLKIQLTFKSPTQFSISKTQHKQSISYSYNNNIISTQLIVIPIYKPPTHTPALNARSIVRISQPHYPTYITHIHTYTQSCLIYKSFSVCAVRSRCMRIRMRRYRAQKREAVFTSHLYLRTIELSALDFLGEN